MKGEINDEKNNKFNPYMYNVNYFGWMFSKR